MTCYLSHLSLDTAIFLHDAHKLWVDFMSPFTIEVWKLGMRNKYLYSFFIGHNVLTFTQCLRWRETKCCKYIVVWVVCLNNIKCKPICNL